MIQELQGTVVNQYKIVKLIGTGAYGLVFLVEDLHTHQMRAVKTISKKVYNKKDAKQSDILLRKLGHVLNDCNGVLTGLNTINLEKLKSYEFRNDHNLSYMKELCFHLQVHDHPNVITIHEIIDSPLCLFIVMEYFPEGDLFQNIVDKQLYYQSTPSLIKSVFIQLIDVISYCHSKNIYHCDLKPENIMCAANGQRLIIGDFGLSVTEKNINVKTCIGSSYYMPPERLITANTNMEYDGNTTYPADKGDIWSLCIILINLTCMRNPWTKACGIMDTTYANYLKDSKVLKEILPLSDQLYQLLKGCLKEDPLDRLSLFQLRQAVAECDTFTTSGPLSVPDSVTETLDDLSYTSLTTECLVPQHDPSYIKSNPVLYDDQDASKKKTNGVVNYRYLPRLRNKRGIQGSDSSLDISKFKYVNNNNNVVRFMNGDDEEEENYSILTNISFNLNEGYFGSNINGYFGCFSVK